VKVLVIGSGGREHALCWALAASPLVDGLFCAPGNGGIREVATCLPVDVLDFDGIVAACRQHAVDFVVVGPEAPLVAGLVDRLTAEGIRAFGPNASAARLEGSKAFTKEICTRFGIPTAASGTFSEAGPAKDFVRAHGAPIVVKADGLAAGKGVIIAMTVDEALTAVDDILGGQFGAAGAQVVIEEFLEGEEISFFALCDGRTALELVSAQDHKRVFDGDQGPNTGGMGAYSPAPALTPALQAEVMERIIAPTMAGMAEIGAPFTGILFAGLMLTKDGPKLLEYNTRFGDPECEVLMLRLKSDLLPALIAACDGQLADFTLRWRDDFAMCVVMAANGYPGAVEKGSVIGNLEAANAVEGVKVFHAGTRAEADGRITAQGGRVLGVSAIAGSVAEARDRAYRAVDLIDWPGGFCRRDIGWRALG